jgi:3-oxoacyl-[acyl-carrier-protein] synthase II
LHKKRIVVTGMGVICPIGHNIEDFWANLVAGKSGVKPITHFDTSNYTVKLAAEVNGFDPTEYMDLKTMERTRRSTHFAIAAAKQAIKSSGLDMSKEPAERVGIITTNMLECTIIAEGWETLQKRGPRRVDPLFFTKSAPGVVALQIGMLLGARGPNTSVNSLCASGADAIGSCMNFIRLDYADVMLATPTDASLDAMTIAAMSRLGALSTESDPDKASRPFDLNRNGFVYGEGAGVMILESYEHAKKRGAPILAEIAGAGWTFDAYDATAPQSETEAVAMRIALKDAGVKPEEVDYINAHGTSTKLNDVSETRAIKMVFGERAYKIPISAHKSMFGHMVTAGGAVESIGAVLTLMNGIIPPTANYETPDPECDLDYVPNVARKTQVNVCLKNSFGLGGQNCCLVLKRFKEG